MPEQTNANIDVAIQNLANAVEAGLECYDEMGEKLPLPLAVQQNGEAIRELAQEIKEGSSRIADAITELAKAVSSLNR